VRTLSPNIKDLTENFFIDYVNEKYKSHPNYEMIFWEFIKNSQNAKVFKTYPKINLKRRYLCKLTSFIIKLLLNTNIY